MSLAAILRQTAYVASVTGIDAWGKPVFGPAVARKVRVEQSKRMVLTAKGEEAPSSHRLWCTEALQLTDRVWLPGVTPGSLEAALAPLAVSSVADFVGSKTLYRVDL